MNTFVKLLPLLLVPFVWLVGLCVSLGTLAAAVYIVVTILQHMGVI